MSHSRLSYVERGAFRVIAACLLLAISGAIAMASGSTARRGAKSAHPAGRKRAAAQAPAAPTISKFFSQTKVAQNGTVNIGFSIGDPDGVPLTGLAFSDTLPVGRVIA